MSGYLPLTFIEEKVMDLENALFFSLSDAVLKIPCCVIKVLRADELGQLMVRDSKALATDSCFRQNIPGKTGFFQKRPGLLFKNFRQGIHGE